MIAVLHDMEAMVATALLWSVVVAVHDMSDEISHVHMRGVNRLNDMLISSPRPGFYTLEVLNYVSLHLPVHGCLQVWPHLNHPHHIDKQVILIRDFTSEGCVTFEYGKHQIN